MDFSLSCKDYNEKILEFHGIFNYSCPHCGSIRRWSRHGTYDRYLIIIESGLLILESLHILRLLCKSCDHTHAILPRECVPYFIYGVSVITEILADYYAEGTPKKPAQHSGISWQCLYSFISRFLMSLHSLEMALREISYIKPPGTLYSILKLIKEHPDVYYHYFKSTKKILFMSRANAPPIHGGTDWKWRIHPPTRHLK